MCRENLKSGETVNCLVDVLFQRVSKGSFVMGSPLTEKNRYSDEAQVEVSISKPFEIMETTVTQSQWHCVMGSNPSYFKKSKHCEDHKIVNGVEMCPNNPVEQVSWNDVQVFIGSLNADLGLSNCYRLPTEAEWEYSARAGTKTAYFFGNKPSKLEDYAWYDRGGGGVKSSLVRRV